MQRPGMAIAVGLALQKYGREGGRQVGCSGEKYGLMWDVGFGIRPGVVWC
jgi:hypothetical protein